MACRGPASLRQAVELRGCAGRLTMRNRHLVLKTIFISSGRASEKGKTMDLDESDLCGWELNNPDHDIFDIQVMEILGSCGECRYADECVMPCESVRRLVPKEGRIVRLGHEKERDKPRMSYFALLIGDEVKFIQLTSPDHYWATASYISHEHVPTWALSQFNQEKERIA